VQLYNRGEKRMGKLKGGVGKAPKPNISHDLNEFITYNRGYI
jgi:hypothetical protein